MSLFELIGLIVVMLALLAPILRRIFEERARRRNPEEYRKRQEERQRQEKEALRRILSDLGEEIPEELQETAPAQPQPEPARPKVEVKKRGPVGRPFETVGDREFRTALNVYEETAGIEQRAFADVQLVSERMQRPGDDAYAFQATRASSIASLIRRPSGARDMILLREILEPPVALR